MKVTILGSGTSTGVPVIGCACEVCQSQHPKNQRTRTSILLEFEQISQTLLIDTSPDLRQQMLKAGCTKLDWVLYTHTHADHTSGFDDLRPFCFKRKEPLPCGVFHKHQEEFLKRFYYSFENTGYEGHPPKVELFPVTGMMNLGGIEVHAELLPHGHTQTLGFRFGSFAYATDFKNFPEAALQRWKGKIHTMIASGLRYQDHPSHSTIPETLQLFEDLQVKQGILIHMSHDVDYEKVSAQLPEHVELAYDGMTLDLRD